MCTKKRKLSLPMCPSQSWKGNIKRPEACHVKYLDYSGKEKILKADGLLATCIQHEIDHCNGILFIDYLSKLKKAFIVKKLTKAQKNQE